MKIENKCLVVWNKKAEEVYIPLEYVEVLGVPHNDKEIYNFDYKHDLWTFIYRLPKVWANTTNLLISALRIRHTVTARGRVNCFVRHRGNLNQIKTANQC